MDGKIRKSTIVLFNKKAKGLMALLSVEGQGKIASVSVSVFVLFCSHAEEIKQVLKNQVQNQGQVQSQVQGQVQS